MEPRALLLFGLVAVYWAPAAGQFFEDPTQFFKNMSDDFDSRLRGSFMTPHCVRVMMNCWELMETAHVCSEERVLYASPCTAMNSRMCTNMYKFGRHGYPYFWFQLIDEMCYHYQSWSSIDYYNRKPNPFDS